MDLNGIEIRIESSGAVTALGNLRTSASSTGTTLDRTGNQIVNFYNTVNNGSQRVAEAGEKISTFSKILAGLGNTVLIVQGVYAAATKIWGFFSGFVTAGAQVETFEVQFAQMLGSFDKAKVLLAQIRDYANHSPFEFPEAAQAARTLYSLTGGMEDIPKLLVTVGDVAARTGKNLGETADTLGRLYATLKLGTGFDDPLRTLTAGGVIKANLAAEVTAMSGAGKDFNLIWSKIITGLKNGSEGASELLSRTYEGLTSTLGDAYNTIQAGFGRPIAEALKAPIRDFGEWLGGQEGLAGKLGAIFGDNIKLFYGLFRTGQLGAYLKQEFELGMQYIRLRWEDFASWAGGLWTKYISDPFKAADFGTALLSVATDFKNLLVYAMELGANRLRASLTVMVNDFKEMLSTVKLPYALGGGTLVDPSTVKKDKYSDVVAGLDAKLEAPTLHMQPFVDSVVNATRTILGLDDAANKAAGYMALMFNPVTAAAGAAGLASMNVAASKIEGSAIEIAGAIKGARSYVFGTEMTGGPDRSAQKDHFYDSSGVDHPENRNLGAYNNTNLLDPDLIGAAVSEKQASALTGITDGTKALQAVLGQVLQIQLGDRSALVRIVDKAPDTNNGIELTPAAHRAVGDTRGDAPISYGLQGGRTTIDMDAARKAATVERGDPGKGMDITVSELEAAKAALGRYKVTLEDVGSANDVYQGTAKALQIVLKAGGITQGEYTSQLAKAQEKLMASNATYKELAASIGQAAAAEAEYQRYAKQTSQSISMGTASAGQSVKFGALSWSHEQGNADQQYLKATQDGINALANDSTNLFTSLEQGTKSASQAFKEFMVSILNDIAAIITKMLVLQAIKTIIGLATHTAGGWYTAGGTGGDSMGASVSHNGGIVGIGSHPIRNVDPALFAHARRYHNGLAGDEFPTILQRGETVLPRGMSLASNAGGNTTMHHTEVNQNITYNNGKASGEKEDTKGSDKDNAAKASKIFKLKAQEAALELQRPRFGVSGGK